MLNQDGVDHLGLILDLAHAWVELANSSPPGCSSLWVHSMNDCASSRGFSIVNRLINFLFREHVSLSKSRMSGSNRETRSRNQHVLEASIIGTNSWFRIPMYSTHRSYCTHSKFSKRINLSELSLLSKCNLSKDIWSFTEATEHRG